MKKFNLKLALIFLIFFVVSCSRDTAVSNEEEISQVEEILQKEPLTPDEINREISLQLQEKGYFRWSEASDHLLWSAVVHGDNLLTVGYGDQGYKKNSRSSSTKEQLITLIETHERTTAQNGRTSINFREDEFLAIIDVMKVKKIETIQELRKAEGVRYIEPGGYVYSTTETPNAKQEARSIPGLTFGCGFYSESIVREDYTIVEPKAKAPWAFYKHNIPSAWKHSTGEGVTIGIVDTGLSENQPLLNSRFNDGQSSGRTLERYGVYVDSWWPWSTADADGPNDKCGHGTSMASVAAAPRNDEGMPMGVAYNANLVTYRASNNVILGWPLKTIAVADAFVALANRDDVNIISMSMGHILGACRIEDAVRYAYERGKLIFCAGGTSTVFTKWIGVCFPAWMDETVAVTGIDDSSSYRECDVCHKGEKIDFTVVIQRSGDGDRNVLAVGPYDGEAQYVGGSSVATAMMAGIAALVWAKHPNWTRDQVLDKLKKSSDFYPEKHPEFGYGNVDVLLAVQ